MTSKAQGHISQTVSDLVAQYCADRLDPAFAPVRRELYRIHPEFRVKTADEIANDKVLESVKMFKTENTGIRGTFTATVVHPGLQRHISKNREMLNETLSCPAKLDRTVVTIKADGTGEMEMGPLLERSALPEVGRIVLGNGTLESLTDCIAPLRGDPNLAKFDLVQEDLTGGLFAGVHSIFKQKGHTAKTRFQAVISYLKDVVRDDSPLPSKTTGRATVRLSSLVMSQLPIYLRTYLNDQFEAHHKIPLMEWITKFESSMGNIDLPLRQQLTKNGLSPDILNEFRDAWYPASVKIQSRYIKDLADRTSDFVFFSDTVGASHNCLRVLTVSRQDFDKNNIPFEVGECHNGDIRPLVHRGLEKDLDEHFTIVRKASWTWKSEQLVKQAYQVIKKTKNKVTFAIPHVVFIVEGWILRPKHAPEVDLGRLVSAPAAGTVVPAEKPDSSASTPGSSNDSEK